MTKNRKRRKGDTHVVGHGIWQETVKNLEDEKCTNQDIKYAKNPENCGKCEMHTVGAGIWQEKKTEKCGK